MKISGYFVLSFLISSVLTTDVHGKALRTRENGDPRQETQHRKLVVPSQGSTLIANKYIIVLKDSVKSVDAKVEEILAMSQSNSPSIYSKSLNGDITEANSFNSSLTGITMSNVSPDALQVLLEDKDVKWIEQVSDGCCEV